MKLFKISRRFFSKDEQFWEQFRRKKSAQGRLEPQKAVSINLIADHEFKYSNKHFLSAEEFFEVVDSVKREDNASFVVIDAREEEELSYFPLQKKNKLGVRVPLLERTVSEVMLGNTFDFPKDKVLIFIDSIGLKSRRAANFLYGEGYNTTYLEGGYDQYKKHLDNSKI